MTILVDVHAHITHNDIDPQKIIRDARKNNVKKIIANGLNTEDNKKVLQLSKKYKEIQPALGLYPREDEEPQRLIQQVKQNKDIVALGEVGLDYKKTDTDKEKKRQRKTFELIVCEARKLRKPLIIHSRGAEKEVLNILENNHAYNPILHCFTGNKKQWRKAQKNGYYLSIPTNIVRAQQFKQIVEDTPIHQLLTETDAPYLSPDKNYPNTPSNIKKTIQIISEIKGLTPEDTAYNIFMNYQRLFIS